jgi:type II secretory pathway component GspD/PulD (secretin)
MKKIRLIILIFLINSIGYCQLPKITNIFIEADIRQVLRDISTQAKIPIICDDTVRGVITVELEEVELEKALEMVLAPGGYVFKKIENYYLVGSPDVDNPTFRLLSETEYITPNYIKAEDIPRLLSRHFLEYIQVDAKSNTLAITAPRQIIERIKKDIACIDKPAPQIMIEAMVIELSEEARKTLGIDWTTMEWSDKFTIAKSKEFDYSITGAYSIKGLFNIIDTLVKEGKAEIKATPRLLTTNAQKASIYVGKEEYLPLITGRPGYEYTRLEEVKVGVNLEITPYIAKEKDEITVEIEPQVSEVIGKGLEGYPIVSKRSVKTIVCVKDGQTIIIGGLLEKTKATRKIRIPILSKIPLIGNLLFSHTHTTLEETEVMIFITPHILK